MLNGMPLPESKLCGLNGVENWRRAMIGVKRVPKPITNFTRYSPPDVDSLNLIGAAAVDEYLLGGSLEWGGAVEMLKKLSKEHRKRMDRILMKLLVSNENKN